MLKALKKAFWKWGYLRKLTNDAFVKEAMAVYSDSTIEDLEFLKREDLKWKAATEKELAELANETEYTKTRRRRDLEKDLEGIEIKLKGRDRSIESVKNEAETLRAQAQELWHRRDIFKKRF
jgi:hypothetical protein